MKKETAIDSFLKNVLNKYLYEISLILLLITAVVIRISLASYTDISPDYNDYFKLWVEYYKEKGVLSGLGSVIGDYYAPLNYMYALCALFPCEPWVPLAIIPCICEFISAYFLFKIFLHLTDNRRLSMFVGTASLFLPYVVMNGALWKQVDAIYSVTMLIAFYYILKQNYRTSILWYALTISIKFQAIIFLPLYVILYITEGYKGKDGSKKNFSILEFLWIPLVYFVLGLPEVFLKNGLRRTYLVYFDQAREMDTEGYGLTALFPNLYNWGFDNFDEMLTLPIILTLFATLVVMACLFYKYREKINTNMLVYITIWIMWTCLMLMPGMHERYDYPMLLILTPFAVLVRKKIVPAMLIANLCSLVTYARAIFGADMFGMHIVAAFYAAAYFMVTVDIIGELRSEDKKGL